jgi:hypothetical protein
MSDAIAIAAPLADVAVEFHRTYPEAVGALVAAVLGLILDGITGRVRILSDNPWLVQFARWGVTQAAVAVRNAGSKR